MKMGVIISSNDAETPDITLLRSNRLRGDFILGYNKCSFVRAHYNN